MLKIEINKGFKNCEQWHQKMRTKKASKLGEVRIFGHFRFIFILECKAFFPSYVLKFVTESSWTVRVRLAFIWIHHSMEELLQTGVQTNFQINTSISFKRRYH